MQEEKKQSRWVLLALAGLFALPLVAAWLAYFGGSGWVPGGQTNRGELLDPPITAATLAPDDPLTEQLRGNWTMLVVARDGCTQKCVAALQQLRQVHTAQGKHRERIRRVLLAGGDVPAALGRDHPALVSLAATTPAQVNMLAALAPAGAPGLRIFLADPLSNVILAYPVDGDPNDLYEDLKHLLKLSRIG